MPSATGTAKARNAAAARPIALIAGSAHYDIVARPAQDLDVIDQPGDVSVEIGGTACNVALNLANLGIPCRFLTAMGPGVLSGLVAKTLVDSGIDTRIVESVTLPTALFSAHLDASGEMRSAITSTPVERHRFAASNVLEALNGTKVLILDCNLSGTDLDLMTRAANGLDIPVFVLGVSEPKVVRVLAITGRIEGLFLNRREALHLQKECKPPHTRYEGLAKTLRTTLFVTRDADGAAIVTTVGIETVPTPPVPFRGNRLGGGDGFAAGVLYYLLQGKTRFEAARLAVETARDILSRDGCNLAASQ